MVKLGDYFVLCRVMIYTIVYNSNDIYPYCIADVCISSIIVIGRHIFSFSLIIMFVRYGNTKNTKHKITQKNVYMLISCLFRHHFQYKNNLLTI